MLRRLASRQTFTLCAPRAGTLPSASANTTARWLSTAGAGKKPHGTKHPIPQRKKKRRKKHHAAKPAAPEKATKAAAASIPEDSTNSLEQANGSLNDTEQSSMGKVLAASDDKTENNSKEKGKKEKSAKSARMDNGTGKSNDAKDVKSESSQETPETAPAKVKSPASEMQNDSLQNVLKQLQRISSLQNDLPSPERVTKLVQRLKTKDKGGETNDSELRKALQVIELYRQCSQSDLNTHFFSTALETSCAMLDAERSWELLLDMHERGEFIPLDKFTAVLDTCKEAKKSKPHFDTLQLMQKRGMRVQRSEYHETLNICYMESNRDISALDTALSALKELRASDSSCSAKLYMSWLYKCSKHWRADLFLEILMEMRLSNVEVHIPSLTSLRRGRVDPALTVMEGVRAMGLDPHFAMHSIVESMRIALDQRTNQTPISKQDIEEGMEKFKGLKIKHLDWPVTPIPQLLETQAAGMLLSDENFARVQQSQVAKIDEYLRLVPIDVNLTLNLKKQLQRMSLMVNTSKIRRNMHQLRAEYEKGEPLIKLSQRYNYPPVSVMRMVLQARGLNQFQIKYAMDNSSEMLSQRDRSQLKKAKEKDSIHKADPYMVRSEEDIMSSSGFENLLEDFVRSKGIRFYNEAELRKERATDNKKLLSPDILFIDPVVINGVPIRWIDAKNYYGAHLVSKHLVKRQLEAYVDEWGPGAVAFSMGFSDMISIPGVMCLDLTPVPRKGWEHTKMKTMSSLYKVFHQLDKRPGVALTSPNAIAVDLQEEEREGFNEMESDKVVAKDEKK